MDNITAYVSITETTATSARERVLHDLNALTNGEAEKAINLVKEYEEFCNICKEVDKVRARELEKQQAN